MLEFEVIVGCKCFLQKKKRKKKEKINKVSSTPLRSMGVKNERDDPCTCAGIKCNCTRNIIFLVTFHYP